MPRKPMPGRTRGFVLVAAAVSIVALLGVVGLAIDIGRLMLAHSELQVFADEAAIAAAFELDGTSAGLTRARATSLAGPGSESSRNRWNFATNAVPSVQPEFAATPDGAFDSNPGSAAAL